MSEDAPRFEVPDIVRSRALLEGEAGVAWLAELDEVLTGLELAWNITIGRTLEGGSTAFVAEATAASGDVFVIKVGTPGSAEGRHEANVLRAAAGKGYVRLVRHEAAHGAMLLEKLGDRLEAIPMTYPQQIDIMCGTLLQAWMPVPSYGTYVDGAAKANSLAEAILRLNQATGLPCPQRVIETALMYCKDRAAAYHPESAVLAHGDPHPANILAVPEATVPEFKFIDPDGLAIEPAYDLGVLLRAWHEGIAGRHAHDIARSHARHLTSRTQVPAEAIWQWGYIERVSTGLHLMELGELDKGRQYLAVAELITP